jgi:DNA mismatch repair protein MutL
MGKIHVLPPEAARLIAAGEVIDRPAAVLRELLDNALDAGAREIVVELAGGGIDSLRVADDGEGMGAEDLALAILPHATSKIASADDLLRARTLGFRGEALPSIAAAARLEILTRDESSAAAARLRAGPGLSPTIEAAPGRRGTAVEACGLFEDYPARRRFLKRPAAEAGLCRQVLVDKALAHPGVAFRYSTDGRQVLVLPPTDRVTRVGDCAPEAPRGLVYGLRFSGAGFEGEVVLAGPAFHRADRRLMQVFVNRRRVQDWGLLSGLDYAFEGFLPGGAHPLAFLFLEIDPAVADFNIHPAKREVRLKEPEAPRRAMSKAIQDFLRGLARRDPGAVSPAPGPELGWDEGREAVPERAISPGGYQPGASGVAYRAPARADEARGSALPGPRPSWEEFHAARERSPASSAAAGGLSYLGTAFGLFLVVERGEELFLIDQHAAHERLLFDELGARPPEVQELLVPISYVAEDEEEERRLDAMTEGLAEAGFRIERAGGSWELLAAPVLLRGNLGGIFRELLDGRGAMNEDPGRSARAMAACKAAVKDGEPLDPAAALDLARRALDLPEPRCPHGRPVWARLTREELFRLVRRIV